MHQVIVWVIGHDDEQESLSNVHEEFIQLHVSTPNRDKEGDDKDKLGGQGPQDISTTVMMPWSTYHSAEPSPPEARVRNLYSSELNPKDSAD